MPRKLIPSLLILALLTGCTVEQKEPAEGSASPPSSAVVPPVEETPAVWTPEDAPRAEPLTEFYIDDTGVNYQVVEAERDKLFTVELEGLDYADWHMVGDNILIHYQQENVTVLDQNGRTLAEIPSRGKGVGVSKNHFAVVDYDRFLITVYDSSGQEYGVVPIGGVPGTVQQVSVDPDGSRIAFTSDPMNGGCVLYAADLPGGEAAVVELEALEETVRYNYALEFIDRRLLCVEASEDETALTVYIDMETGALEKVLPLPQWQEIAEGEYVQPRIYHSASGVIFQTDDEYTMQLHTPFAAGDRLNGLYRTNDCGGVWMQYLPLTGQGRAGFFPLYDFLTVGALDDDTAVVAYFDSGVYQVERVTLTDRFTTSPAGGIDLSEEGLSQLLGQRLYHRFGGGKGDAYRLVSSVVTQYVDAFAASGYLLDDSIDDLADQLYWFVLLNNYGVEGGMAVRLEHYYLEEEGLYHIPADVVEAWVENTFQMDWLEVDLRTAEPYEPDTDGFTYGPGFGFGETDTVYLADASYSDGVLDLTAVVLPSRYAADQEGRDQPETIRLLVRYDQMQNTFAYLSVERLQ